MLSGFAMVTTKVAITIDSELIAQVDDLVTQQVFPNRSKAIQSAIEDKLVSFRRSRLERELMNLDPLEEQQLADEGIAQEFPRCPEY
jgi:Arc/MetJ-type ribon-helix-helix transcriptional regulator